MLVFPSAIFDSRRQTQEISAEFESYQGVPQIRVPEVNWSSVRLKHLKSLSSFEKSILKV